MPNPNAEKANKQQTKSLETLLISKNRKLQDDLTTLRVMHDDLLVSSRMNTIENEKLKTELEKLKTLNENLENDLSRMQASSTEAPANNSLEMLVGKKSDADRLAYQDVSGGSMTEGPGSENSSRGMGKSLPVSKPEPHRITSDTSILPIITSQRDRFRQRNLELEEELRKQFETISTTRNEMKSLQNDNLKLYEKVRYLQSYRDNLGSTTLNDQSSRFNRFTSSIPSTVSRKDEELSKYRGIYEEHMNPFEKFRGRVSCLDWECHLLMFENAFQCERM